MKSLLIIILLLFTAVKSVGQNNIHTNKFIHRGAETKPIGTILICIEKVIIPNDKTMDKTFGRGIKTDKNTFKVMEHFIKNNKYTRRNIKELNLNDDVECYEIVESDETKLYLAPDNYRAFFPELKIKLKENKCDINVIKALL